MCYKRQITIPIASAITKTTPKKLEILDIKSFYYTFRRITNAANVPALWNDRVNFINRFCEQSLLGKPFIFAVEVGFQVLMRLTRDELFLAKHLVFTGQGLEA